MIMTLARGHDCAKEHQQHLEPAANFPAINGGEPAPFHSWNKRTPPTPSAA
jgi:hypothetical protein